MRVKLDRQITVNTERGLLPLHCEMTKWTANGFKYMTWRDPAGHEWVRSDRGYWVSGVHGMESAKSLTDEG